MHKIELTVDEIEYAKELFDLSENNEGIDIITEKNFTGDLTTIELYISLAINVIVVVIPVIKTIIKQNKVSSLKIDGEKIEVTNVSQELIESILKKNEEKEAKNKKRSKG